VFTLALAWGILGDTTPKVEGRAIKSRDDGDSELTRKHFYETGDIHNFTHLVLRLASLTSFSKSNNAVERNSQAGEYYA
jgi:hypothetical protein